jgi:hypothetical protein
VWSDAGAKNVVGLFLISPGSPGVADFGVFAGGQLIELPLPAKFGPGDAIAF